MLLVSQAVFHPLQHRFVQLSSTRTKSVVGCNTLDGVFDFDLPHILKERVVDTPGHREVQEVRIGGSCLWEWVFVGREGGRGL